MSRVCLLLQQTLLKPFDFPSKRKKKGGKEGRQTAALGVALAGRHSQEACVISCLLLPGWDDVGKLNCYGSLGHILLFIVYPARGSY